MLVLSTKGCRRELSDLSIEGFLLLYGDGWEM